MVHSAFTGLEHPLIFAHRGDSGEAPGNTLVAFARAVQRGADVLELDIHHTKDDVIVVSHDASVDPMSEGAGRIDALDFDAVRKLDFGYRFTTDGGDTFPFRGKGIRIATLRDVLVTFPNMRMNIDIKPSHFRLFKRLLRELHDFDAMDRVMIASFHHKNLHQIRQMHRHISTSASPIEAGKFRFCDRVAQVPFRALQVPSHVGRYPVVTPSFVTKAHQCGVEVHVWTIDDVSEMTSLLDMGVDGIVTDFPGRAVEARRTFQASQKALSSKERKYGGIAPTGTAD